MSYAQVPSHHSPPIKPIKRPHSFEGEADRPHITPTAPITTAAGTATPTALPEKDEGADNVADFDDEASKLFKQLQSSSSSYHDPPSLSSPLQHQDGHDIDRKTPTSVLDKIAPANERVEQRHENIRNIYDIEPTTPVKESTSTLASPTLQGQEGGHIYDFNHEAANLLKAIAVSSPTTATAHAAPTVPGAVEGTGEDDEKVDTEEKQALDKVDDPITTTEHTTATIDAHDDDDEAVIETDTATAAATSEAIGDDDGAEASPDPTTTATSPSKRPNEEKRNKNNKNKK